MNLLLIMQSAQNGLSIAGSFVSAKFAMATAFIIANPGLVIFLSLLAATIVVAAKLITDCWFMSSEIKLNNLLQNETEDYRKTDGIYEHIENGKRNSVVVIKNGVNTTYTDEIYKTIENGTYVPYKREESDTSDDEDDETFFDNLGKESSDVNFLMNSHA